MRLSLFSLGILLALTLIVAGCGGGDQKTTPAPANTPPASNTSDTSQGNTAARVTPAANVQVSGQTSHPSQEVVKNFLSEIARGNTQGAFALFTPKAQQEYIAANASLDPQWFQGMKFRIIGGDILPDSDGKLYAVHVNMVSGDETIPTVWCVRQLGNDYRIANLIMSLTDDDGQEQFVTLDFENPAGTRDALFGNTAEQQVLQQQVPQQQAFLPDAPVYR